LPCKKRERLPAKNGSVCLQELKQTDIGRAIRAGACTRAQAYAGGRVGQQAQAGGMGQQAPRMAQGGRLVRR